MLKESPEDIEIRSLADSLNISETLARALILRGIKNFHDAKIFFRPSLEYLHDPFLMSGLDLATLRVIDAVTSNQKILIYGDYDVDGTCSTALMFMFLKELGANVEYFIPSRLKEGYGISYEGIEHVKNNNAELMISVDCGITAIEEASFIKSLGIDLIICDHHQPKETLPDAYAVLDPLKPGCNYPFKYLSGAGVAFKLIQGIAERIGRRELPFEYLDLVALAGAADIVPLTDENRILVKTGLEQINSRPRPGILALIECSKLSAGTLNSGQVVFTIAPRINAVGRLSDASVAVELLITKDQNRANELAQILEADNRERRKIDEDTLLEAVAKVDELNGDDVIVLHDSEWHPGVIGIVASRLVEKYYKPAVLLTTIDGIAKGSARSTPQFNIYDALKECEDTLIHFGGHKAAAGLAVEVENIDLFRKKLNRIVKEKISGNDSLPIIAIDSCVKFGELSPKFFRIIDQFSPFGPGNMRPVFLAEDVSVAGYPRAVGNDGKHLLLSLKQNGCDKVFDAIGFDLGEYYNKVISSGAKFDIAFSTDQMTRDGRTFPQFKIKDILFKEETTN